MMSVEEIKGRFDDLINYYHSSESLRTNPFLKENVINSKNYWFEDHVFFRSVEQAYYHYLFRINLLIANASEENNIILSSRSAQLIVDYALLTYRLSKLDKNCTVCMMLLHINNWDGIFTVEVDANLGAVVGIFTHHEVPNY